MPDAYVTHGPNVLYTHNIRANDVYWEMEDKTTDRGLSCPVCMLCVCTTAYLYLPERERHDEMGKFKMHYSKWCMLGMRVYSCVIMNAIE